MSDSPETTAVEAISIEAIAKGVAEVREGPERDLLDELEASAALETQLKCDLLRARIGSIRRRDELAAFVQKRRVRRIDYAFVAALLVTCWTLFDGVPMDAAVLYAVVYVLAITTGSSARMTADRVNDRASEFP